MAVDSASCGKLCYSAEGKLFNESNVRISKPFFQLSRKGLSMKARLIAVAVAVLMAVSFSFAQDFTTSVASGGKAMLFSLEGLSNLGAGEYAGGVGGKYYVSNQIALRVGFQFATATHETPVTLGTGQTGKDGSQSGTMFGILAGAEYHFLPTRVSPYVGAGISFSTTSTESKNAVVDPNPQVTYKNRLTGEMSFQAGTELAVAGIIGVEFFITKEISLSGEYQIGYFAQSAPDQERIEANVTTKTKVGGTSGMGVASANSTHLTLSVYF